jgi:hypothetical protein
MPSHDFPRKNSRSLAERNTCPGEVRGDKGNGNVAPLLLVCCSPDFCAESKSGYRDSLLDYIHLVSLSILSEGSTGTIPQERPAAWHV